MAHDTIRTAFQTAFARPAAGLVRAPGRVNLIGEHTDYNDGFVLPIAIDKQVVAEFAPRGDGVICFRSRQTDGVVTVGPSEDPQPVKGSWGNYPVGVLVELRKAGLRPGGADVLFDSNVPLGGGLSSSAALEVATALALLAAFGKQGAIAGRELALLCQRAENLFAGAPCGIMDQSISVLGQAGHALLLDCRDGKTTQVPFEAPGLVLLVMNTQVKHDIGEGGYPLRRRQCHEAAAKLGVKALRDCTGAELAKAAKEGRITGDLLKRARHVVGEIERTLAAVAAARDGDYAAFGRLMYASHDSLRDDFEVTCEELDCLVDSARNMPAVLGARMTGGGFGGCAIALVKADYANAVTIKIADDFERRFGRRCPVFATSAANGAGVL
jgi:galactokinase